MPVKDTAVIIVNWNGKQFLPKCFDSLRSQTYQNFEIFFIDNGSTDGSLEFVHQHYPETHTVALLQNTGFAHANNMGIQKALPAQNIKYIVTLNNDTYLDNNFLTEMVRCAERHPQAAAIQGKVLRRHGRDDHKIIDATGILIYPDMSAVNRGQNEPDQGQFDQEEEIFGASASAALYRRAALEKIRLPQNNYFDDIYSSYLEDVDLAWRLRLAGFSAYYTPRAVVYHEHSATGIAHSPFKAFHIHRNHYYNLIKNLPLPFLLRALAFMPLRYVLLLTSMWRRRGAAAALAQKTKKLNIVNIVLKSWRDTIKKWPILWQQRTLIKKTRTVNLRQIHQWFQCYRTDIKTIIYGEKSRKL